MTERIKPMKKVNVYETTILWRITGLNRFVMRRKR